MTRKKIGTVTDYDEEESIATVELTGSLSKGDKIAVLGPVAYQSEDVEKMTKNGEEVDEAEEGDAVDIPMETSVRENKSVYKIV